MLYPDSQTFCYRYEYEPAPLGQFILDRYFQGCSLEEVEETIHQRVRVNDRQVPLTVEIKTGDVIQYLHYRSDEEPLLAEPQILFEDEFILALSKPDDRPVIPGRTHFYTSMAIWVKEKFNSQEISPMHRLDLETSGVLLFGKNKRVLSNYQKKFERQEMDKTYQAVTFGRPLVDRIEGEILPDKDSRIFTKYRLKPSRRPNSLTLVERVEPWGDYSLVTLKPVTGKLNQLRIHLAHVGCPIVGDKKYYPDEGVFMDWFDHRDFSRIQDRLKLERQALHCTSLAFEHHLAGQDLCILDETGFWPQKIAPLNPTSN